MPERKLFVRERPFAARCEKHGAEYRTVTEAEAKIASSQTFTWCGRCRAERMTVLFNKDAKQVAAVVDGAILDGRVDPKDADRVARLKKFGEEHGVQALRAAMAEMKA